MTRNLDRKTTTIYGSPNAEIGPRQTNEDPTLWCDAIFCAMCSAPNLPDAQFCNRCGRSLLDQRSGSINVQAASQEKGKHDHPGALELASYDPAKYNLVKKRDGLSPRQGMLLVVILMVGPALVIVLTHPPSEGLSSVTLAALIFSLVTLTGIGIGVLRSAARYWRWHDRWR